MTSAIPPASPAAALKVEGLAFHAQDAEPRTDFQHLYHHLNTVCRSWAPSRLKELFRYMGREGMLSLAGGLPHPELFPFQKLDVLVYDYNTRLAAGNTSIGTVDLSVPKTKSASHATDLSTALQYGDAVGLPALQAIIGRFVKRIYSPAYDEYQVVLSHGSTDGWHKVVSMFLEYGDTILVEAQTYPASQALWIPMGCTTAPVTLDGDGMVPEALDKMLDNWHRDHAGRKKPRLMYCIPVGQNPTGSTLTAQRKRKIYDICVRHDIIICEDDPYYFLQFPTYDSQADHEVPATVPTLDVPKFIDSLEPSFLKYDYDGRVIRLDTFSKTIAPGLRLGWMIANPLFAERLLRASELFTQTPAGWSQAIVTELLTTWGDDGYLTWVNNLRETYIARRNWMCSFIDKHFDVDWASMSADGAPVYFKSSTGRHQGPVAFKFVPPKAGMFVWLTIELGQNPHYQRLKSAAPARDDAPSAEEQWMTEVWEQLAEARVLLVPGSYYASWHWQGHPTAGEAIPSDLAFFRLSFSMMKRDGMDEAIRRMEQVFKADWYGA